MPLMDHLSRIRETRLPAVASPPDPRVLHCYGRAVEGQCSLQACPPVFDSPITRRGY